MEEIRSVATEEAQLLFCNNGFLTLESLNLIPSKHRRLLFSFGAERTNEGVVIHGDPTLIVGPGLPYLSLWEMAGFKTIECHSDRVAELTKLPANMVVNSICTLARKRNGALIEDPALWERACKVLSEFKAVATALGYTPPLDLESVVRRGVESYAGNINSSLADLSNGRPTELPDILGSFIKEAHRLKVSVPTCETLWAECASFS